MTEALWFGKGYPALTYVSRGFSHAKAFVPGSSLHSTHRSHVRAVAECFGCPSLRLHPAGPRHDRRSLNFGEVQSFVLNAEPKNSRVWCRFIQATTTLTPTVLLQWGYV